MDIKIKIKKELRSKVFWISIASAFPFLLSHFFKELQFLQIIYGAVILSAIPLMASAAFSPEFAAKFVRLHKRFYGKSGTYTHLPTNVRFSIWKSSLRTAVYLVAIIYTVLDWSGITEKILGNLNGSIALLALSMMALIAASIIEISIYLLKRYGLFFENKKDGTKINLGNELHNRIEYLVSPIVLISFTHVILTKSFNVEFVIIMMLTIVGVSFYSTTISFFILRRKNNLDKLMSKLELLLNKK